jgi:hypothetical protein
MRNGEDMRNDLSFLMFKKKFFSYVKTCLMA